MQPIVSIQQFNKLQMREQAWLLKYEGIDLQIAKHDSHQKIALYALYNYYVEVLINETTQEPQHATAFNSYKRLQPFLQAIDITPVYALL